MKVGDLVKMKPMMFWQLKGKAQDYTEEPLLVIEHSEYIMRLMYPGGRMMRALPENYHVISKNE